MYDRLKNFLSPPYIDIVISHGGDFLKIYKHEVSEVFYFFACSSQTTVSNRINFYTEHTSHLYIMAYKLSFKIERNKYTGDVETVNRKINQDLVNVTNAQRIELLRIYQPSRDSIKALFPDEKNLNKALNKSTVMKAAGFEPRISMALKAARTVYCYNLDNTLPNTYTQ